VAPAEILGMAFLYDAGLEGGRYMDYGLLIKVVGKLGGGCRAAPGGLLIWSEEVRATSYLGGRNPSPYQYGHDLFLKNLDEAEKCI